MLYILYGLVIFVTIFEMLFFKTGIAGGIVAIGFSLGLLLLKRTKKKNIGKAECWIHLSIAVLILVLGCINTVKGVALKAGSFNQMCVKAEKYIADGKYDKADNIISELENEYGENDVLYLLSAKSLMNQGKREEALNECSFVTDKNKDYYIVRGAIIASYPEMTDELYEDMEWMSEEAAKKYPEWADIQKICGNAKAYAGKYKEAEYYLSNAITLNKADGDAYYALGAVYFYESNYEQAETMLSKAKELGLSEEDSAMADRYLADISY